jgi:hypothetical protein
MGLFIYLEGRLIPSYVSLLRNLTQDVALAVELEICVYDLRS